jgi:tricorn protease interacting factor F2/3
VSYDLHLDVDFAKAHVNGKLAVTVKGAAKPFVLDASELSVASVSINGRPAGFVFDEKRATLRISGVPARQSVVEVEYTKQVSDDVIFGLYKSKYGRDYILVTDLEPAEARTVFPCVDNPAHKAVFRLQITTEDGLGVIANTPIVRREIGGAGRTTYTFQETPRMSTYLFFFAIGKFEETKLTTEGIEVITATRPGQGENSQVALEITAEALVEYQRYYGVPYPLKKLHVVALPEYHTGAMENWGAIASRESYALIREDTSFRLKNRGAMSMVHEVAHQWFGDLVTMKWWDDLWLNESFATFMSYKMTQRLRPDWEMWGVFLRDEVFLRDGAMTLDALSTTHPVQAQVKNVAEATHTFDSISYGKGACVLRMLEGYIGEETFRKGVSDYLKKFSYSNATGKDLWEALGVRSGLPVTSMAREWLTRPGYPLVTARVVGDKIELKQRRFRLSGDTTSEAWPIPIKIQAGGNETSLILTRRSARLDVDAASGFLLNPGRTGFYITHYDEAAYDHLAANFSQLSSHDRAGLMNDLFLLLEAGSVDPELYARFVRLCGGNPDSVTTQVVAEQLRVVQAIASDSPIVREIIRSFYPPLLDYFGETPQLGEPAYVGATREYLTSQFARADISYAREMATLFDHFSDLDPNLKAAAVIGFAVTHEARAEKILRAMVTNTQSEVERDLIYRGLSAFRNPKLVGHTLDLGLTGRVSRSDLHYSMIYAALNPYARDTAWRWVKRNYDAMWKLFAGAQQFYTDVGRAISVCAVEHESDAKRFLSGRRLKEGGSSIVRVLEMLHVNARLRKRLLGSGN